MKNKLHQYPTNYIFDSTLGRDEITPQWVAKLNQLTTYLDKYLNGIDKIHWDFYRYKDGCFFCGGHARIKRRNLFSDADGRKRECLAL